MDVFHDVMYLSEKDAKTFGIRRGYTSWGPLLMDLPRRRFEIRGDKGTFVFEKVKSVRYRPGLARWIFPVWLAGSLASFVPEVDVVWSLYGTVGTFFGLFVAGLFNKHRVLGYVCVETENAKHYFRHVKRRAMFAFAEKKTREDLLKFLERLV